MKMPKVVIIFVDFELRHIIYPTNAIFRQDCEKIYIQEVKRDPTNTHPTRLSVYLSIITNVTRNNKKGVSYPSAQPHGGSLVLPFSSPLVHSPRSAAPLYSIYLS